MVIIRAVCRCAVFALAAGFCGCCFRMDGEVRLERGKTEVVVAAGAVPTVKFAGAELTNFLSRVLGAAVPMVESPTEGRVSVILGENAWAREAGVGPEGLERDAFVVKAEGTRIYVCGRDDPKFDIAANLSRCAGWGPLMYAERATLFGVYDLLERYAGVRFYLPDEAGTIVPRADFVAVPAGTRRVTPDYLVREPYFYGDGSWYCEKSAEDRRRVKSLYWLRLRFSTIRIPCCHGSQNFHYTERFAATHPEFFALKPNGGRWTNPKVFAAFQYCWSDPGFQEELYQDVKAYLTGKPASSRGLKKWGVNCFEDWVDIMPDDSFSGCWCERCQAAYKREADGKKKVRDYATELIWGVTAKIGQRLIDEKIEGRVTQMAYLPYGRVPDFPLPTNVHVMVAQSGPWSVTKPERQKAEYERYAAWAKKLGHKIWTWTYPHKFGSTMIAGVPCMAPRAWGKYYAEAFPWIFGSFAESESDKSIYNHLNYYVFSRVCWDTKTDIDAVLDEYYRLMFGAGAKQMKAINEILEEKWLKGVVGRVENTSVGPVAKVPSVYQLWHDVYSPTIRAELRRLADAAAAAVPAGSGEAERIAIMRREIVDPLLAEGALYEEKTDVVRALARRAKESNRSILPPIGKEWGGAFALDTGTFVTPPHSIRFSGTNTAAVSYYLSGGKGMPALKPDTTYRLSYFVKTEGVEPRSGGGGGISVNIWDDQNRWFPGKSFFSGTMDWIYQEYTFKTGPLTNNKDKSKGSVHSPYLWLHRLNASGTAWFDDVRLEEVNEKANEKGKDE